jgi:DNA-binding response OmpR family regulator
MPLEIFENGRKHAGELEDLSSTGMFVRVPDLPTPVPGAILHVAFTDGTQRVATAATVAHVIREADARVLGRWAGIGLALPAPVRPNEKEFALAVERLIARQAQQARAVYRRIVVATPHPRMTERLGSAFRQAGYVVDAAAHGVEAIVACERMRPDVLLVERTLPILDGYEVITRIAQHGTLAGFPIVMMSDEPRDAIAAFELGVHDFVAKPFSTDELVLRVGRFVRDTPHVMFRGELSAVGLPALLALFELERKSGQLVLARQGSQAWIDLDAGRIVDARSTELIADPHDVLMTLLDWAAGQFELSETAEPRLSPRAPAMSVTHLLLEHARRRDEAARAAAM